MIINNFQLNLYSGKTTVEALKRIEATGDIWHWKLVTINLLRKHQQSTEKEEERIVAATILFLSTESNICSLLYLGCSGDETT